MEPISPLFVGYPGRMALVAALFVFAFFVVKERRGGITDFRDWILLMPAVVWGLAALWEFWVVYSYPQTTMRLDWFIIAPVLILASLLGITLTFRPERNSS